MASRQISLLCLFFVPQHQMSFMVATIYSLQPTFPKRIIVAGKCILSSPVGRSSRLYGKNRKLLMDELMPSGSSFLTLFHAVILGFEIDIWLFFYIRV